MCHVDKFRGPTQTSQNVTWKEGELPSKPLPTSTQLTCQGFDCASAKSTPNTPSFASWVAKGRLMAEREQCRNVVVDADFGRDQRRDSLHKSLALIFFPFLFCNACVRVDRRVRKWADLNSSLLQDWWHLARCSFITESYLGRERERVNVAWWVMSDRLGYNHQVLLLVGWWWCEHCICRMLTFSLRGADSVVKQFGKYLRKLDSSPDRWP